MIPPTFTLPLVDPTTVTPPANGLLGLVANLSGQLTTIQSNGTITPLFYNNILSTVTVNNAAGNSNIGPGNGSLVAIINITGAPSIRQFLISTVGLTAANDGDRIRLYFNLVGQVAGINLQVYNSNSMGALLFQYLTDGVQQDATVDLVYNGTAQAWEAVQSSVPAT